MSTDNDSHVEDTENSTETNTQEVVTYTQEQVDAMMARTRNSTEHKVSKKFEGVDIDEYRELKAAADKAKQKKAIEKGEFEKILQELAQRKDAEIEQRDKIITEYKVNSPLLDAAAKHKAVNPAQVRQLLNGQVRLNDMGDVEVVDSEGKVRYSDAGTAFTVEELVSEFLDSNPHFVQPTPSTTNTQSNHTVDNVGDFDLSKLDLTKQSDRELYAKAKAQGKL